LPVLLSLVLELKASNQAGMNYTSGRALRALFLDMVARYDWTMAADLHRASKEKPYTVSPVFGDFIRVRDRLLLSDGAPCWLRFTSIEPELSKVLLRLKQDLPGTNIALLEQQFQVTAVHDKLGAHPWAAQSDYRELYNSRATSPNPVSRRAKLSFISPTTFRNGRINIPLPVPRLFFSQLSFKWNQYSPVHLGTDIAQFLEERIGVSYCDVRTSMLNFGSYREVGFTGTCEFMLPSLSGDVWDRIFHVLCDFAFYSGVGAKCTAGMGQVRRLDSAESTKPTGEAEARCRK